MALKFLDRVWGPTGHGPPPTDDLTPVTQDLLFTYQLAQPDPLALTPQSLKIAKITETDQYSTSVFKSAQSAGVISSAGLPVTGKVDAKLVSKIAVISVPKVRELVNLLCFWEEEVRRLRTLMEEEEEVLGLLGKIADGEDEKRELEVRLQGVRIRRAVVPSRRLASGEVKEELPGYEA